MTSILYISMEKVNKLELYQIYFQLFREITSDKPLAFLEIDEITEDRSSSIFIQNKENKLIFTDIYCRDLESLLIELEKSYELYLIITKINQTQYLSKFIDKVITLKKEDLSLL